MEDFGMFLICLFFAVAIISIGHAAAEDSKERLKQEEARKRIEMSP